MPYPVDELKRRALAERAAKYKPLYDVIDAALERASKDPDGPTSVAIEGIDFLSFYPIAGDYELAGWTCDTANLFSDRVVLTPAITRRDIARLVAEGPA